MNYNALDAQKIVSMLEHLERRVGERFDDSSLRRVCRQLCHIGRSTQARTEEISQPIMLLRVSCWLLTGIIILGLMTTVFTLSVPSANLQFIEFVQVLEAGINDVVLIGAAIFFLFTLETRIRRKRVLHWLHELRSIAHVVDMHQLTKDPGRILSPDEDTASSPKRDLTPFQMNRYFDYCSEMLSLTGKLAALYAQNFDDAVILASVNEVESLTTGLSRKIWQKAMILQSEMN